MAFLSFFSGLKYPHDLPRLSLLLAAALTWSSGWSEAELEEIVVTADLLGRDSATLPASITVLDRATIEESAVQHFEELIFTVPNLNWSGDGNRARYFQIRGVGELEQYEGAPNPSVGFVIDDIDFSGIGGVATLFDIQQIEVLRGPQGTRYGANALAGLVYVRSVEPTAQTTGELRLTAGEDGAIAAGFAFGGPVTDDGRLRYRVSAHQHQSDGFRNNPFLGRDDTNGRRESTLRGKLSWQTDTDWLLNFTGLFGDLDDGYDAFALDNGLTVLSDRPGRDAQRSYGAAFKAIWQGSEAISFTAITTLADSDIDFSFDADWGNEDSWAPFVYDFTSASARQRRTISQEFRVASSDEGGLLGGRAEWLAGLYMLQLTESLATRNQGEYFDPFFDFSLAVDDRIASRFESLNAAAFGQLQIAAGDTGRWTIGIRLENRGTDYQDSDGLNLGPDESMWGGELAYSQDLGANLNAYLSLAKGYRAGGFNLGLVPEGRRKFQQESLWNLETGLKSRSQDGRLMFNAALFVSRRQDQQVRTSFQLVSNDPASFVFFTANAARGETVGLEADMKWIPAPGWELYASMGLMRARFERFVTDGVDLSGRDQPHAPRYSMALGGVYRAPGGLFARVDLSRRDEFYFDVSHDQKSQSFELINARVGFESQSWTIALWARNLLDENYAVRGFFFGNEPPDFPDTLYVRRGDPRQLGITARLRF